MAQEAKRVRYQVLAPVFVNGSLVDPKGGKDVFVHAAPGLEGTALKLAPERDTGKAKDGAGDKAPALGDGAKTIDPQRDAAESQGAGAKEGKAGSGPL